MARDNIGLAELTNKYADFFFEDLAALNIVPARCYPRATEHIDDIVRMVQDLVERGNAYEVNGSYYFKVQRALKYGRMARLDFEGMEDGRSEGGGITDSDEYDSEKESARDFALWKAYKEEDGDIKWVQ